MAPRLKVFVTSDGFNDYVVAVSSRAKALAAWGAHQDLFQTGGARETNEAELVGAALAEPGKVLRRPAASPPPIPAKPKFAKPAAPLKAAKLAPPPPAPAPRKPRGPTPAQLRKIAELEAELEAAAERHEADLAQIAAEKKALEARRDASETRFLARRSELREQLRKARLALR